MKRVPSMSLPQANHVKTVPLTENVLGVQVISQTKKQERDHALVAVGIMTIPLLPFGNV